MKPDEMILGELESFLSQIIEAFLEEKIKLANLEDYSMIPRHLMDQINEYVKHGVPLCGFLNAIFSNDLMDSIAQADNENLFLIPLYCKYVFNKVPYNCHGSPEIVEGWIDLHKENKS